MSLKSHPPPSTSALGTGASPASPPPPWRPGSASVPALPNGPLNCLSRGRPWALNGAWAGARCRDPPPRACAPASAGCCPSQGRAPGPESVLGHLLDRQPDRPPAGPGSPRASSSEGLGVGPTLSTAVPGVDTRGFSPLIPPTWPLAGPFLPGPQLCPRQPGEQLHPPGGETEAQAEGPEGQGSCGTESEVSLEPGPGLSPCLGSEVSVGPRWAWPVAGGGP